MKYFITFEGPEGSGKTSAINALYDFLCQKGYKVVLTREPGGVPIAEEIRNVILSKSNIKMDERTEALLYAASRRQHLIEKVLPALKEGAIVVCDRYIDSSLAYQGHARGIGIDEVLLMNQFATDGVMPGLTILFDLSPEVGLERIHSNKNREINRLDLEKMNFHHLVREGFLHVAEKDKQRIKIIDASKSKQEVIESVIAVVDNYLRGLDA